MFYYLLAFLIVSATAAVLFGRFARYGNPSHETAQPQPRPRANITLRVIGALWFVLLLNATYSAAEAIERPRTAAECGQLPGALTPPLAPCATSRARIDIARCNHDADCILSAKLNAGIHPACARFYADLEN